MGRGLFSELPQSWQNVQSGSETPPSLSAPSCHCAEHSQDTRAGSRERAPEAARFPAKGWRLVTWPADTRPGRDAGESERPRPCAAASVAHPTSTPPPPRCPRRGVGAPPGPGAAGAALRSRRCWEGPVPPTDGGLWGGRGAGPSRPELKSRAGRPPAAQLLLSDPGSSVRGLCRRLAGPSAGAGEGPRFTPLGAPQLGVRTGLPGTPAQGPRAP